MLSGANDYNNIDHPVDRSLLSTCVITLLFLIVSLILFGPFIAILVPSLIAASICRFFMNLIFCQSCHSEPGSSSSIYYSPDQFLTAEETRWLKSKSKTIILMTLDCEIDVTKLQSLVLTRLVQIRKEEAVMNPDSVQQPTIPSSYSNQLLYPRFSQRILCSKTGSKWRYDDQFNINNHIHHWKESVSLETLSDPRKLSEVISRINSVPFDIDHPPWDCYVISATDMSSKVDSFSQVNDHNEGSCDKSVLLFRLHPSLCDGISLVHILCASFCDEQYPIELKKRFHSSGKFINSIRALFIGPVVFIQKWFLTRRDNNIFHPFKGSTIHFKSLLNKNSTKESIDTFREKELAEKYFFKQEVDRDQVSIETSIDAYDEDRLFQFRTYPLSIVSRIKCITRSTLTEVFLAAVAGALRTYQQNVSKVHHPYDLLCLLPTDLTKEHHTSTPGRNSSSMVSKTSNQSSTTDLSTHITNNYSLVDFGLPTNTEGMIPRLWEVKQRMEELKNSADSMILCGLSRILKHLFPESVGENVMKTYYNKNSLSISSLQGPDSTLFIDGKQITNIIYWFPSLYDVSMSVSCFSYGDSLTCSVTGENSQLPGVELILDAVVYQIDLLNKLLENRRIPGEHKSQRYAVAGGDETKITLNVGKFDTNEKEMITKSLSPSISTDHLYTRLSSIQNQLQNDRNLSDEDLDNLRCEFSKLLGILRRRKSCGIDGSGEMADFDEEIEEMSHCQTGGRRPSIPGLMVLSTRRRSLATSLSRPLNTGTRSRSNSKAALQSSNCLISPSYSASKRTSLRYQDDVESGFGSDHNASKIENKFQKYNKSKVVGETTTTTSFNNPRTSRNESSPLTVSSHSNQRISAEKSDPRRCREDKV